ncbi:MAG: hypothetical protein AAB649_01655 [Patescibacteria group bacterium]
MTEKDISKLLQDWWQENKRKRNCWQTPLGKQIKIIVKDAGNWKNKPRGRITKRTLRPSIPRCIREQLYQDMD